MIDRERLLKDLQKQVTFVERDLTAQLERLPEVVQRLSDEHCSAFRAGRTSMAAPPWIAERVTQAAVAWVLGTVFVRFCEDNSLIVLPYLAGPTTESRTLAQERHGQFMIDNAAHTHRGWLLESFGEIGSTSAGRSLFDRRRNPIYQIPLSNEGAKGLVDFWRLQEESAERGMRLVHDFTDSEWGTRFLGDLYQDLDASVRDKYALFQTPEFVEEFILDLTLDKAIDKFGHDAVQIIDPTCGSGHFLLGAFHRILACSAEKAPSLNAQDRVEGVLKAIHGVDLNPHAVAIARFRLIVAALKAAGILTFQEAGSYEWPLHLAVGDALLKSHQKAMFEMAEIGVESTEERFSFETEDIDEHLDLLKPGKYHVVVGNPPYVAVKDAKLRDKYRSLYRNVCHGRYALSVPFMQRFFELAVRDERGECEPGFVGQITSNSFMKREFGENLVTGYLATTVDLTDVIDSSGAYIPHHGTPTVIVIGRNRPARMGAETIRTVRGIQGEPDVPSDPALGLVWRDIVVRINDLGKSVGDWVAVDNLPRKKYFGKHPWVLSDGGREVLDALESVAPSRLSERSGRVGVYGMTNADDVMIAKKNSWQRMSVEGAMIHELTLGDQVREWGFSGTASVFYPYSEARKLLKVADEPVALRDLWGFRTTLGSRATFSGKTYFADNVPWYSWHQVTPAPFCHPWTITYGEVSTHNHFVLDREGKVFKQTAPIIKLPEGATEEDHLKLLGALNSSVACFWLKQMCHNKGSAVDKKGARQSKAPFDDFYQFNSTNVQEFPLPAAYPIACAAELDALAQRLTAVSPAALAADPENPPTADALAEAREEWHRIRAQMIAVQEELDWEVYTLYGLHKDLTAPEESLPPEGLALGQRAFEIDLGKRVNAGEAKTEWFRRHNSTMIDEIPAEWPEAYKDTVRRRLDAMQNSNVIGLIERPEYKRRWLTEGWDKQQHAALREWLLARMERRELWYQPDYQGIEYPRTRSIRELVEALAADSDFTDVAALYAPGKELSEVVPELVEDQHVPFLAALRYQEPIMEKKRAVWEDVWDMQRAEDAATAAADHFKAKEIRDGTPVPPKYTTKDFRKDSYGAQRGSLDVPRERFISYSRTLTPAIEVLGWGGWDHAEQATALTQAIEDRRESGNWDKPDFLPYLAGLLELLPWVRQWHPEDAGFFEEVLLAWQSEEEFGVTDAELRAWRPTAVKRTRKAAVKKAKAPKVPVDTETAEQP
ncbi:BREX-2 system adenine-specific DNA-methyltransferase PglX [Streptomyces sp. NBC_00385]|uniref:BREX-2 system adenine-specific DNA-methyltransferase PglX n=1 Tax=Streptomyces sp. NBC_00385 TaxID=2975733 RepID=UPI002DDA8404|nr:BREX-2 system adenine-specific DNA-methyltransferase PglX [Streptomyces sp. NBC_00385]WRZ06041.1 BREX-2 system adenine-specific DNA-methyltransferase PglX [Streptomyces sp. NBC_00385]